MFMLLLGWFGGKEFVPGENFFWSQQVKDVCYDDIVFSGWGEVPLSGVRDAWYWRSHIRSAFPEWPQQPKKMIIVAIEHGQKRFIGKQNAFDLYEAMILRVEEFVNKFEFFDVVPDEILLHDPSLEENGDDFPDTVKLYWNTALLVTVWNSPALANIPLLPPDANVIIIDYPGIAGASRIYDRMLYNSQNLFFPVRARNASQVSCLDDAMEACVYDRIPTKDFIDVFDHAFTNTYSFVDFGFKLLQGPLPCDFMYDSPTKNIAEGEPQAGVQADNVKKWNHAGFLFSDGR